MIINGGSYRAISWWADHLQSKENDRAGVVKSYGLRSDDIREMLHEMETLAHGTRCENFFYQMNLNPARGEVLSPEEWERAREIAEKQHGLEGQPYFVVEHVKHGRPHQHIVWSRISVETGKTISDSNDARKNHAIARTIESEMGLEKVISPYDREEGQPRPPRAPKPWEMYRGMKTGIDPRDIAAEVTELYHDSRNGPEFQAALEQHGYQLLKGDRRAFVILDSAGKDHSLARRLNGVTTKELNRFMRDVDREALLTVDQGKELFQERKIANLEADRATVRDEIVWEEALAKAAISKEEKERRLVEPDERSRGDAPKPEQAGSRKEGKRVESEPGRAGRAGIELSDVFSLEGINIKPPVKAADKAAQLLGGALGLVGDGLASLISPTPTPEQKREGEKIQRRREAEAEANNDHSRITAEIARQRQQQENEREAARQRERENGGAGRDR